MTEFLILTILLLIVIIGFLTYHNHALFVKNQVQGEAFDELMIKCREMAKVLGEK